MTLRAADITDAAVLFEWVNQSDSRKASLKSQDPVSWGDHCAWLAARLADPGARIWIIEVSGRAAGQIRFQDKGGGPEIAIYVEPEFRRAGIAVSALTAALDRARLIWPGRNAIARVRLENAMSRRLFERAQFSPQDCDGETLIFTRLMKI